MTEGEGWGRGKQGDRGSMCGRGRGSSLSPDMSF